MAVIAGDSPVHNLAYLPPRGTVPRPELQAACAAVVPGDDAPIIRRLHVPEEHRAYWHVPEGGCGRVEQRPACCQHHYLGNLPPRHLVAWAELQAVGAAIVPGYQAGMVGGLYEAIEGIGSGHIPEGGDRRGVGAHTKAQHHYLG